MNIRKVQMSESLLLGSLLALAGGFFDAYSFICRGGVFANAQTGNMVLFGINIINGEYFIALKYLVPVFAFAIGVIATELIKAFLKPKSEKGSHVHWRQLVLIIEMLVILFVAFMPQEWNMLANILISFICAMQVQSFRKVRGSAFATTMCTGNLRSGTEQLFLWAASQNIKHLRNSFKYYSIIIFFILGAALGTLCTKELNEFAVLPSIVFLLLAIIVMFINQETESYE